MLVDDAVLMLQLPASQSVSHPLTVIRSPYNQLLFVFVLLTCLLVTFTVSLPYKYC